MFASRGQHIFCLLVVVVVHPPSCHSAAEALKEGWFSRADSLFAQCLPHPGVLAFLLDQLSELLELQAQQSGDKAAQAAALGVVAAAAADQGQGGAAAAASAGGASSRSAPPRPHIPEPMLAWLFDKVNVSVPVWYPGSVGLWLCTFGAGR